MPEITYKQNGTTVIGNLTYEYDKNGNRTKIGGTWARTGVPQNVATTSYDANNRQLTFGDKTLAYDDNGNLQTITDASGTTIYSWNARNQLVGISGPTVNANFVYDGLGRREKKTINNNLTEFLYDGVNPVQETAGATVLANILTGLGIDEFFSRTDVPSAVTSHFLPDALGSAIALADSAGAVQTEYNYEPFGKSITTGASSSNPLQYTGRENDGTGPYYYRFRYYHARLQRFLAQDPIGFDGGDFNLYAYVGNNPTNHSDPLGLWQWYGNWGGPDYTGGQVGSYNTIDQSRARPPIDKQDQCYRDHDKCYGDCRNNRSCKCPDDRSKCFRDCDRTLARCLRSLRGDPSNNLSAIIAAALFDTTNPGSECK